MLDKLHSGHPDFAMDISEKEALHEFIKAYRLHPELWDVGSPSYSNDSKKAAAYDILLEKLKLIDPDATRESVKEIIDDLRSAFRKEVKKDTCSKKNLWWFEELMFLLDKEIFNSGIDKQVTNFSSHMPTANKKRKLIPNLATQNDPSKAMRYLETEDDECLALAKGYATKLRKLTAEQLMFADKLLNCALFDAQMGRLTKNSFLVHPVPSSALLSSRCLDPKPSFDAPSDSDYERNLWKLDEEIWNKLLELLLLVFQFIEQAYIELFRGISLAKLRMRSLFRKIYLGFMPLQWNHGVDVSSFNELNINSNI